MRSNFADSSNVRYPVLEYIHEIRDLYADGDRLEVLDLYPNDRAS